MKKKEFIEGVHFYFDETGLMVMTEKYHLDRGFCCGNGCRHCPYNYKKVEETLQKELLAKRKINKK